MTDSEFITFQDDFYDLLEKYGVKLIDCDHSQWDEICNSRNILVDSIDKINAWPSTSIMLEWIKLNKEKEEKQWKNI